ncbi:MAG: hypothetical protein ACKOH9_04280 [Actinomycetota bacterium]
MTIKRGQDWGQLVERPDRLHVFDDDSSFGSFLSDNRALDWSSMNFAILKSEAARDLGLSGARTDSSQMLRTSFDLIEVQAQVGDLRITRFLVGQAVLGNGFFRGRTVGVFNVSFHAGRDWAPRAHPNDGKMDVVEFAKDMKFAQRFAAYRKLKTGSHLPHPDVSYHQSTAYEYDDLRATRLTVDSLDLGAVKTCTFQVIVDAVTLYW